MLMYMESELRYIYVAAMLLLLSLAESGIVFVLYAENGVHEQCWFCMACQSERGRSGLYFTYVEGCEVNSAECCVHLVGNVHVESFVVCTKYHKIQGWCEGIVASFPSSLVGF